MQISQGLLDRKELEYTSYISKISPNKIKINNESMKSHKFEDLLPSKDIQ